MSKRKSKKKKPLRESSTSKRRRGLKISASVAAVVAVAVVAVALYVSQDKAHEEKKGTETPVAVEMEQAKGNLQALIGRWLRLDGGYIIEIRRIRANGLLDAAYFNPRPINVSRAEASRRGGEVRVFMELQDVGYPGSTYTPSYDPPRDVLRGVYFHAGLSQTFDVVFVRAE